MTTRFSYSDEQRKKMQKKNFFWIGLVFLQLKSDAVVVAAAATEKNSLFYLDFHRRIKKWEHFRILKLF